MVGLVNQRIAAFEEMSRMETVQVKQFPVPKYFVGKLVSFYEHEVSTKVEEAASNAQVVKPVGEASKAPTTLSESSSYWTARSHFEKNGFGQEDPRNEDFQNGGTQETAPAPDEDEEIRLRRSRFIFHVNAPATNISEAIARAQRGRGLPRARFYLARGMKIIQNATERMPASSKRKEESQHSQDKKSTAKNTGGFKIFPRTFTNTDPSTSVITPTRSESGDDINIGFDAKVAERKRIAGKAKGRSPTGSSSKQYSQHSGVEKFSAENTSARKFKKTSGDTSSRDSAGSIRNTSKKEGKKSPPEDTGNIRKAMKADGKKSPTMNMGSVRSTATTDGTESSPWNAGNVRKLTKAEVTVSPTTNTRSVRSTAKKEDKKFSPENSGNVLRTTRTGGEKCPAMNPGSASNAMKADGKRSPATNMTSPRNTPKKEDKNSPTGNTGGVRKTIKTDGRKCFPVSTTRVRRTMETEQSTSTVTPTRSEVGDDNRLDLGRGGGRRRKSLFSRLRANLRGRRERKQRSQQGIVVHQLSRRVSSNTTTTIPFEVNVPYPRDASEPANSFAATIHLKFSLTRDN